MPKAKLVIEIEYADGADPEIAGRTLDYAVDHLADNGLLTGDDTVAETWSHYVEWED